MVNCSRVTEVALCATVFYRKRINGNLYPKAARTGPFAFAEEVSRVNGRVVTRYVGIIKVPEGPPSPISTRVCKHCRLPFSPSWVMQKYCCKEHAYRWKIEHNPRSPEKIRKDNKKHRERLRTAVLVHYSGDPPRCACCGEETKEFLAIGHINNDGYLQRRDPNWKGRNFYQWLLNNAFPKGYQVLCHNCNLAKSFYDGCPHKRKLQDCLIGQDGVNRDRVGAEPRKNDFERADVIEMEEGSNDHQPGQPEEIQQKLQ